MVLKIGLIAEDVSDIEVIKILAKKITGRGVSTAHHVGKGCGPLKKKSPGWCKSLATKGCSRILLVHDRDRNSAKDLRITLEQILEDAPQILKVVVIPEEELEAWFLSDVDAIARALKIKEKIKSIHHPERINSPKEHIRDQLYRISQKRFQYVNSVHNKLIANEIDIKLISNKCPSFERFYDFFKSP